MKVIGLMPVRNEDWILGLSARSALLWCDELVILLHSCTDRSREIAREISREHDGRVTVIEDDKPAWDEMRHRQQLLLSARARGATHIAIVDADEILTGNLLAGVRREVETAPRGSLTLLPGYNLRGGIGEYHANGIWGQRWFSVAFADDPRLHWTGDRFHHREPMGLSLGHWQPYRQGAGGVMHLWGASEGRLIAKHALYKMIETLRWPDKNRAEIDHQYSLAFDPAADRRFDQNWEFSPVPASWWAPYGELIQYLDIGVVPWQETECRRLAAEHGPERFAGLDLFGISCKAAA